MNVPLLLGEPTSPGDALQRTFKISLSGLGYGAHFEGVRKYPLQLETLGLVQLPGRDVVCLLVAGNQTKR